MSGQVTCPICRSAFEVPCYDVPVTGDRSGFSCGACGRFSISRSALVTWFRDTDGGLNALQRSALAHLVRTSTDDNLTITTDWLGRFAEGARLPSPAEQAANLIRLVGDCQVQTGEGYFLDGVTDAPLVGSFNPDMFEVLRKELMEKGLLSRLGPAKRPNTRGAGVLSGSLFGLTLDGWERYEADRKGGFAGKYGFIAMKFGDVDLERFVADVVKPGVKAGIGYDLVDLRNVSRAGVIDNILRTQIRDSAFVLVDLTHDNAGAYWEAGYAEGLGKPVVYLCQRAKFDEAKTHFDTNHCTTVMWQVDDGANFTQELVATLRRSLNLFPSAGQ